MTRETERGRPHATANPLIAGSRRAFESAVRRGDARAAGEAYAIDAILVAPGAAVLTGRRAIEAFWRAGLESGVSDVALDAIDVRQQGDAAVEFGHYVLRLSPEDGAVVVDRGRYLIVHRVDGDGRWRRAAEMFSPDGASSPGTP